MPAERWQGNWIPHQLRPAVEDGIFFVGDSAGHCLPTTAEGIRPAFYFGLALGRELVDVVEGRQTREQALRRYGAFSDDHLWQYRWMLRVQNWVGRITPTRLLSPAIRAMSPPGLVKWSFSHYRDICRSGLRARGRRADRRAAARRRRLSAYGRRTTRSRATIPRSAWSPSVQTTRYRPRLRSVTRSRARAPGATMALVARTVDDVAADDPQVVRVLAEVLHVKPQAPGPHAAAVQRDPVLAQPDAHRRRAQRGRAGIRRPVG